MDIDVTNFSNTIVDTVETWGGVTKYTRMIESNLPLIPIYILGVVLVTRKSFLPKIMGIIVLMFAVLFTLSMAR